MASRLFGSGKKSDKGKQKPESSKSWFELANPDGTLVLDIFKDAAKSSPVIPMKQAIVYTLALIRMAGQFKDNEIIIQRLALDVSNTTANVYRFSLKSDLNGTTWPTTHLSDALDNYIKVLKELDEFCVERTNGYATINPDRDVDPIAIREFRARIWETVSSFRVPSHFDANDTLDLVKQQIDKQLQEMEQLQVVRLQLQVQSDVRQNLQNDLSSKLDEIGIQKACYRSKQREILEKKEQDEEGLNRQKQEFKTIADRLKSLLKEHQDLIREIEAEKLKQETAYTASLRHEEQIKRLKERQAYFMVLTPKKVGKKSAERGRQRDTGADNEMAREMERRRQAATEVLQQARAEKVKMSASATVNALTDSVARVGLQDRGGPGPNAAQAMARRHYESLPTSPSSGAAALLPMEAPATIFESGPIAGSSGPRLSADVTSVKSAQT